MKKKDWIWIGLLCIILGVVLSLQYKYITKSYLQNASSPKKVQELISELNTLKEEREQLRNQIESLEGKLDEIKNSAASDSSILKNLNDELSKYKMLAGLTKLQGSGVIITLDNPPVDVGQDKNLFFDYKLVLELLNELNSSGAEALSVNEQRIVQSAEIRLAGNELNVNITPFKLPLVIKAIGDSQTLEGGVLQRFGVIENIRESGYYVEVKAYENIEIPAYNGTFKFNFANGVKNEKN